MDNTNNDKTNFKVFAENLRLHLKKIFCSKLFLIYSILLIVSALGSNLWLLFQIIDLCVSSSGDILRMIIGNIPFMIYGVGINALWEFSILGIILYKSKNNNDIFGNTLRAYGDSYLTYKKIATIFIVIMSIFFVVISGILVISAQSLSSIGEDDLLYFLAPNLCDFINETVSFSSTLIIFLFTIICGLLISAFVVMIIASLKMNDYFCLTAFLAFSTIATKVEDRDKKAPIGSCFYCSVIFLICAGLFFRLSISILAVILIFNIIHIIVSTVIIKKIKQFEDYNAPITL